MLGGERVAANTYAGREHMTFVPGIDTTLQTTIACPPCLLSVALTVPAWNFGRLPSHRRSVVVDLSREERRTRGTAYVLLMRLNNERLPRALQLKEIVDRGERLSEYDTSYLKRVLSEAGEVRRAANKLPEYRELVKKMQVLYDEITRKALENEQKPELKPKPRRIWPDEH